MNPTYQATDKIKLVRESGTIATKYLKKLGCSEHFVLDTAAWDPLSENASLTSNLSYI